MTDELYNRIADELKDFLRREPTENEVINSQEDPVIMSRVDRRVHSEQIGVLQDQVDNMETQFNVSRGIISE